MDQAIPEWKKTKGEGRAGRFSMVRVFVEWNTAGGVLGPVLFMCYINDLSDTVNSFIYMYADNTKLFRRVDNDEDREEWDLDLVEGWADKWQLRFNVEKCKTMHLGWSNQTTTFQ
jgi:Reverse transcriptase (RNA-dependent DNA polymerase)